MTNMSDTMTDTERWSALSRPTPQWFEDAPLGIFGKAVKDSHILREGDRVEIYRPLQADPKEARRKRAAQNKPPKAA